MDKIVDKKKKKGRPSLLDIQKRNLREEQQNHQQQVKAQQTKRLSTSNYAQNSSLQRSTRTHPIYSPQQPIEEYEYGDTKCRDKIFLKMPNTNFVGDESKSKIQSAASREEGEDENAASNYKKRKVDAIADGSNDKEHKTVSGSVLTNNAQGRTPLVSGPSTPLPDKKLLLFVLDRLQKKDTYGVFSEPVDPEELPDYHEIIEHPMDFGTVKERLCSGAYTKLEEFEDDIFLICSNAMQYNAPDTVYFRQARSIQELAKKTFENLRQDSDDNNEAEVKIVRRGRPPSKFRKSVERELDASVTSVVESSSLSIRKADSSRNDVYTTTNTSRLAENKYDEITGNSLRSGKKQCVVVESRRSSYKHSVLSFGGRELSVLTTFDSERKQLMAVGLFSEYSYARSLARFAANLGPLAWKIASKRIGKCLPAQVKFGPGWVGETDTSKELLLPFERK